MTALPDRRLMWHGMCLFLVGLVTGLLEGRFKNMRMALAAHLEGVLNGTFLMALGAIWKNVELPPRVKATALWTALYGSYANWLFTTLAGVFGTAALSPITSAGHSGKRWQETVVKAGFFSVAPAIIVSSVLVLWGLRARVSPAPRGADGAAPHLGNGELQSIRTADPSAPEGGPTP